MVTDGGGWTQVHTQAGNPAGYNTDYSDVFSSIERGTVGTGAYKVDASDLLLLATEFRYSDNSNDPSDSLFDYWNADISCTLTSDALTNIQNPGYLDQVSAPVTCVDLNTDTVSHNCNLYELSRLEWLLDTCKIVGRYQLLPLEVMPMEATPLWCCHLEMAPSPFSGVYYGPSGSYYASVAFWLR